MKDGVNSWMMDFTEKRISHGKKIVKKSECKKTVIEILSSLVNGGEFKEIKSVTLDWEDQKASDWEKRDLDEKISVIAFLSNKWEPSHTFEVPLDTREESNGFDETIKSILDVLAEMDVAMDPKPEIPPKMNGVGSWIEEFRVLRSEKVERLKKGKEILKTLQERVSELSSSDCLTEIEHWVMLLVPKDESALDKMDMNIDLKCQSIHGNVFAKKMEITTVEECWKELADHLARICAVENPKTEARIIALNESLSFSVDEGVVRGGIRTRGKL